MICVAFNRVRQRSVTAWRVEVILHPGVAAWPSRADGPVARRRAADGTRRWRVRIGWAAVCLSTAMGSVYGWWGIVQNFTMGWFEATTAGNVLLMLGYLSPLLAVM